MIKLDFFLIFPPVVYLNAIIITDTNKVLKDPLELGESMRWVGCWLCTAYTHDLDVWYSLFYGKIYCEGQYFFCCKWDFCTCSEGSVCRRSCQEELVLAEK